MIPPREVTCDDSLSLQGIQKSFGTNEVLRDASLVLQDGQRMGLVGVNGCGKSTLMKIIAGIETADGGTMTMQKGLKLGYLAQQGQVGEGRTVLEELKASLSQCSAWNSSCATWSIRWRMRTMKHPFIASAASTTSLPAALRKATAMAGARRCRRAGGSGLPQGAAGTDGFAAFRRRTDAPLPWADAAD